MHWCTHLAAMLSLALKKNALAADVSVVAPIMLGKLTVSVYMHILIHVIYAYHVFRLQEVVYQSAVLVS